VRITIIAVALLVMACEGPVAVEPEPELPTFGTLTVKVTAPLSADLRSRYFVSAKIVLEEQCDTCYPYPPLRRYPITGSVVEVDRLPFGTYRIAFEQPHVPGWGYERGVVQGGFGIKRFFNRAEFGSLFTLGPYSPDREAEHIADYDAATGGVGYLSGCYYDSGYHCHRDRWTFTTGPVALDRTFSEGETHVILVDPRFFRPDTVASGRVIGTLDYPRITMSWDVLGGCDVTGEMHDDGWGAEKWLRVVCPDADIDLSGPW